MTLADDETAAEQVLEQDESGYSESEAEALGETPAPSSLLEPTPTRVPLESGMETGQGADDEPELAIGDRHASDAEHVSPDEAKRLLGGEDG